MPVRSIGKTLRVICGVQMLLLLLSVALTLPPIVVMVCPAMDFYKVYSTIALYREIATEVAVDIYLLGATLLNDIGSELKKAQILSSVSGTLSLINITEISLSLHYGVCYISEVARAGMEDLCTRVDAVKVPSLTPVDVSQAWRHITSSLDLNDLTTVVVKSIQTWMGLLYDYVIDVQQSLEPLIALLEETKMMVQESVYFRGGELKTCLSLCGQLIYNSEAVQYLTEISFSFSQGLSLVSEVLCEYLRDFSFAMREYSNEIHVSDAATSLLGLKPFFQRQDPTVRMPSVHERWIVRIVAMSVLVSYVYLALTAIKRDNAFRQLYKTVNLLPEWRQEVICEESEEDYTDNVKESQQGENPKETGNARQRLDEGKLQRVEYRNTEETDSLCYTCTSNKYVAPFDGMAVKQNRNSMFTDVVYPQLDYDPFQTDNCHNEPITWKFKDDQLDLV